MERPAFIKPDGSVDFSDLDDFSGAHVREGVKVEEEARINYENYGAVASRSAVKRFPCIRCNGSGRFISWAGRDVGPCNRCHGVGFTATDPNVLAQRRQKAQDKKRAEAKRRSDDAKAFLIARPDVKAWFDRRLNNPRGINEFAESLYTALFKYGALTPNQLAAVERSIERDKEFDAKRATANAEREANGIDISPIPSGQYVVGEVELKIDNVAKAGKWQGWVFVKRGDGSRAGNQRPGQKYHGAHEAELKTILANPLEAAVAFGRKTGCCAICSRTLTDPESIARGIGPICAERFG